MNFVDFRVLSDAQLIKKEDLLFLSEHQHDSMTLFCYQNTSLHSSMVQRCAEITENRD